MVVNVHHFLTVITNVFDEYVTGYNPQTLDVNFLVGKIIQYSRGEIDPKVAMDVVKVLLESDNSWRIDN